GFTKVDFDVSGEGVVYYQTNNDGLNDFFSQESSRASLGLQVGINAKVDNGFEIGYAGTFLGTLGLDDSVVSSARQYARANELNAYASTEIFLSKRLGKTNIKFGRQKLSMAYSPLAFSEDWNVFENSFDALVLMNEDIEKTRIMASYINKSNRHNNLSGFDDLENTSNEIKSGIYLLTVANKSLENLPITASYYILDDINGFDTGSALWLDVQSRHLGVNLAFQAGHIDPSNVLSKTSMFGLKAVKDYDKFYVVPLYPHFSSTTTQSSLDDLFKQAKILGIKREKFVIVDKYYDNKYYNEIIVQKIKEALRSDDAGEFELVFSAHGLPQKIIDSGDPYMKQIKQNVFRTRQELLRQNISFYKTHLAYQSRLGPVEWIKPYLDEKLKRLEKKKVIIYPIAFLIDNSETKFELNIEYKEIADKLGFIDFRVASVPNKDIATTIENIINQ
ncbi:MAG: ferrochelatase, partial [Campylobacteraceae bacterium]|nr:ferrochelatase [Campylobacteraceae bacterium]